mgnify:CR=1 FL=1
MKLQAKYFGEIDYLEEDILTFGGVRRELADHVLADLGVQQHLALLGVGARPQLRAGGRAGIGPLRYLDRRQSD